MGSEATLAVIDEDDARRPDEEWSGFKTSGLGMQCSGMRVHNIMIAGAY
jgi:hypothetical protein